jgi:hypothetical protein
MEFELLSPVVIVEVDAGADLSDYQSGLRFPMRARGLKQQ